MEDREYEVCPSCDGDSSDWSPRPYFETANKIGYVRCEWCMDKGKVVKRVIKKEKL